MKHCPQCSNGLLKKELLPYVWHTGKQILLLTNVPSYTCSQCGYTEQDTAVLEELSQLVATSEPLELVKQSKAHRPLPHKKNGMALFDDLISRLL